MRPLGYVTRAHLAQMQAKGMTPQEAVQALMAEAKRRHPDAEAVVLVPEGSGYALKAID